MEVPRSAATEMARIHRVVRATPYVVPQLHRWVVSWIRIDEPCDNGDHNHHHQHDRSVVFHVQGT